MTTPWAKVLVDLWEHRGRTVVVALAIAVGVYAVGVVLNAREGIGQFRLPLHSGSPAWRAASGGPLLTAVDGALEFDFIPAHSAQVWFAAQ